VGRLRDRIGARKRFFQPLFESTVVWRFGVGSVLPPRCFASLFFFIARPDKLF
jgi:hypothetical protein